MFFSIEQSASVNYLIKRADMTIWPPTVFRRLATLRQAASFPTVTVQNREGGFQRIVSASVH
jgi:hypothetical protein